MSSRFFYVELKFIPKSGLKELPMTKQHEAVVEVPKDLCDYFVFCFVVSHGNLSSPGYTLYLVPTTNKTGG